MLDTYEQNSGKKLIATIVAVVIIAGVVILADGIKSGKFSDEIAEHTLTTSSTSSVEATATQTPTSSSPNSTETSSSTTSNASYKDGTYSASSSYYVPHGTESIKVNLTLSGGTITDVSVVNSENDHDSAVYQADFSSSYKSYVVGKKISGLQLSNVAGASDTTQGFDDALSKIAAEAQA